ncbi:MAG: ATP-dependent DNA helicase DinG [Treponema sp.]|nr:ATP-dependent DNA helicase DinG [Treponema sp.]
MQAALRFTPEAISQLQKEIADAQGNEVFALGSCNEKGLVETLRITARGNEGMVPALQLDFVHLEDSGDGSGGLSFDVFIHNHPAGFLTPSDNDLMIAARAAESGIGAYIVDNNVSRVYVVAEPVRRKKRRNLDADKLCASLEENGAVARRLPGYERRDAQLDLVRLITRAFNEDAVAAVEAGTGVGKSFAYLLPALEFALANNERIVISTATITLQQQLYEKDIPLVLSALRKKVKCCLVKGRGNYLCRRRLAEAQMEPPLDNAEYEELRSLSSWAEHTKTGSRSDLSFLPSAQLWSRLCCESDTCLGMRCAERERCFFMSLRRESADARILVVNHHLLFADLAARHEGAGYESAVVLPPYTRVIIDEAHTIENAATSFFSRGWSRQGINRALNRLYRKRRTLETGLLLRLPASGGMSGTGKGATGRHGRRPRINDQSVQTFWIDKDVAAVRKAAEEADEAARALCGNEGLLRLVLGNADPLGKLREPLEILRRTIDIFTGKVRGLMEPEELTAQEETVVWETKAILRRLESAAALCSAFLEFGLNPEDDSEVFWLERQGGFTEPGSKEPWAVFSVAPVNIAPSLKDALFTANKTVICVSATLSTGAKTGVFAEDEKNGGETIAGAFRFWADRTGAALANRDFFCGAFPSPFPYAERTLLAIPADAPLPDSPDFMAFTGRAVTELVRMAGGSALILFTSYHALQSAWNEAAPALEKEGILCLKQGDDDRTRLLQQFLEDRSSVLFGTDSFWEGVDAPGETLRLVILCRLPFRTLKDPVFEARREYLEKRGRNAFTELSLPDAVMKFKQGFGRLMRSSADYGAVAVLDGRILRKYYGAAFLGSLPETKTSFKKFDSILLDLERFLY